MKNLKRALLTLLGLSTLVTLPSCSVVMAARKSGTDVNEVQSASTRGQMLAMGAKVVSSEKDPEGNLVETYMIQKEKGSIARALMHGILDVSTFGVWEAIGTPIEGVMGKTEYFTVKVSYDKQGNVLKRELI